MRIFIGRQPQAITFIQDYLIPDEEYEKDTFVELLKSMIAERPDDMFVPIAIDGDKPVAFLIAMAPQEQRHVWIMQAWASPELTDQRMKDTMFLELVMWTLGSGRRSIRAETQRDTKPFLRRWGFKPFSEVLSYDIREDFEDQLLSQVRQNTKLNKELKPSTKEDSKNESDIKTGDEKHLDVDTRSKKSSRSNGGRDTTGSRSRSVPRRVDSPARSSDASPSGVSDD